MYLIIRKSNNTVIGTQAAVDPTPDIDLATHRVVEWSGAPPPVHSPNDPENPVESYDPTRADVETFRSYALRRVRSIAAEKEDEIDALIAGNPVRAMMLNTEIVQYQNDGRPANPSAAVYALADALATRRGATLRDTLEALRTRWLSVRSRIATIITELDRVEDAINAASTVAEIETILAGLNYG